MRRSPQLIILLVLLLVGIAAVSWYVVARRSQPPFPAAPLSPNGPTPLKPAPGRSVGPVPRPGPAPASPGPVPVDLNKHDGQTIDFSSGGPQVKQTKEDDAALKEAVKEMRESSAGSTFGPRKDAPPAPAPKAEPEAAPEEANEAEDAVAPQASAPSASSPAPVPAAPTASLPAATPAANPTAEESKAAAPQFDLNKVGGNSVKISSGSTTVSPRSKEETALLRRKVQEMRKASRGVTFGPAKPKEETAEASER